MDSGEQPVEDENVILTPTEELNDQTENLTEYKSENVEHSIFQQELQGGIVPDLQVTYVRRGKRSQAFEPSFLAT
jgi:hypothetical protein